MKGSFSLIGFLLFLFFMIESCLSAEVVLITHKDHKNSISSSELKGIYLGKSRSWGSGGAVLPVVIRSGKTHEEFLKKIIGKTPTQFRIYWKRAVFTGAGLPYHTARDEEEVVRIVEENRGAVGYVQREIAEGKEVFIQDLPK